MTVKSVATLLGHKVYVNRDVSVDPYRYLSLETFGRAEGTDLVVRSFPLTRSPPERLSGTRGGVGDSGRDGPTGTGDCSSSEVGRFGTVGSRVSVVRGATDEGVGK